MLASAFRRGLGSAAARSTARSTAPALAARNTVFAPAFTQVQARTYLSVSSSSREEVDQQLQRYHDELLGTNWGDYLELVHNVPFWESELEKLLKAANPYLNDPDMGPRMDYVLQATDCLYACEDVRDHINELLELKTRSNGLMNMGIGAEPDVANLDAQLQLAAAEYDSLLERYPEMKPKIEQCVGHGLAIVRMKHKFSWSSKYRFFY